nr:hypothetical protein [Sinorhizobium meliloti]
MAHSDPRAHCQWLAEQRNRRTHAVELRRLNGLGLSLTLLLRLRKELHVGHIPHAMAMGVDLPYLKQEFHLSTSRIS